MNHKTIKHNHEPIIRSIPSCTTAAFRQAMGWAGYLGSAGTVDGAGTGDAAVQLGLAPREVEDATGWAPWWLWRGRVAGWVRLVEVG